MYGHDAVSHWRGRRQILCRANQAVIADRLRPAWEGVPYILAGLPVRLAEHGDVLASGNRGTTGTLRLDVWTDGADPCRFAAVARRGRGSVVTIAASVTQDIWLEGCPHNTRWLVQLATLTGVR